ncbi:hypothetical protein O3Q51_11650 [Cryomorphaceae bacterium 1068]|nr:hypothetical protein [Cryomorphaceae bacterium 1068]
MHSFLSSATTSYTERCGAFEKTVFNTYFKKETGLTPKQYLNS